MSYRFRRIVRFLSIASITAGITLAGGAAFAAGQGQPAPSTQVAVDFMKSATVNAMTGFTVRKCPPAPTPELQISCAPDGTITFTSLGYVPATAHQQVTLPMQPAGTGQSVDVVYDVTLNPPTAPTSDSKTFDVPFSQGTQATIAFTDIPFSCAGCSASAGPTFAATSVSPATAGQASFDPIKGLVFTPAPDFTGPVDVTYTVTDPFGQTSTPGKLTFSYVKAASTPPVTGIATLSIRKNTSGTVNVLTNDTDPSGGKLTLVSCGQPAHGQVTCTPDGTATYTPNADYTGLDQFSYVVANSAGDQASGTAVVGVEADATKIVERATETIHSNTNTVTPTVTTVVQKVQGSVAEQGTAPVTGVFAKFSGALSSINGEFSSGPGTSGAAKGELASTGYSLSWVAPAMAAGLIVLGGAIVASSQVRRRRRTAAEEAEAN